jgi:hypothetical protein
MPRVTNFSVFVKSGRKMKFMTDAKFGSDTNTQQIVVDGDVVYTDAVGTSSATINAAICVEGHDSSQSVEDAHLRNETVKVTWGIVDGRIYAADYKIKTMEFDTKAADGTLTGSFTLIGGKLSKVAG